MKSEKFISPNGTISYYNEKGRLHREDGPALDYPSPGGNVWVYDGFLHRIDGPAVTVSNGSTEWWVDGKLHRIDGPAIEFANGSKSWYYKNNKIECNNLEEFKKIIKLQAFW